MIPPMDHKVKRPYGRWIPAANTDIRKTFERERARLEAAKRVIPIKVVKK